MTKSRRVLVIEDDPALAEITGDILRSEEIAVDRVGSLAEARRALVQKTDCVVADWNLPDGDGVSFIKELREKPQWWNIPVLLLTVRQSSDEKVVGFDSGADDYLTKPFDAAELQARVGALLRRSERNLDASPLTGLPGNNRIEEIVETAITAGRDFDAVYADIDSFKPFNDHYGFARGDEAIKLLAEILLAAAEPGDFVGHVGGDDFVSILPPRRGVAYAEKVARNFAERGRALADPADVDRGFFESVDRQGHAGRFELLSITAAVVSTTVHRITHFAQLAQLAAEVKSAARKAGQPIGVDHRAK